MSWTDERIETLKKMWDSGLTATQIAEELALPPVKIHCSILAEDAIKAAVADYKKKQDDK